MTFYKKISNNTKNIVYFLTPLGIAIGTIAIILDIVFAKTILDEMEGFLERIEKDYNYMKNSIHELLFEKNFRDYE